MPRNSSRLLATLALTACLGVLPGLAVRGFALGFGGDVEKLADTQSDHLRLPGPPGVQGAYILNVTGEQLIITILQHGKGDIRSLLDSGVIFRLPEASGPAELIVSDQAGKTLARAEFNLDGSIVFLYPTPRGIGIRVEA